MNKLYCTLAANFLLFTLFFQPTNPAKKCGTPIGTVLSDNRIVGGVDVGYYKYPWYVALMYEDEIYCGGTLVSNRYIVSAAHCYEDYFEKASAGKIKLENVLTPIFGVYNICDTTEVTQKKNKISKVFIHEKYNKSANYYDISLLKLKKKAKGFEPCCLPTHVYNSEQRPKEAIITGLGDQIFHDKNATCTLREARILIHSDAVCKKMLDDSGEKGSELHDAFCAGYLQGGIDACQGDSGGPLMILGPESKYILLGVVSFGEGCAKPNRLGVYTDVSKYLDWIYKKMKRPYPPGSTSPPTTSTNQPTGSSQTTPGSTSTGETVTPTKVTPSTASTNEPTDETDEPDESTIPSQTTSASGYHPSTYTFSTDLYTSTEPTERPYHPPYEHNRPIIIIINKKEMQKNKRKRGNCQVDG